MIDQELIAETEYAIARQLPAMSNGCSIDTDYGSIGLDSAEAERVAVFVKKVLLRRIIKLIGEKVDGPYCCICDDAQVENEGEICPPCIDEVSP
jgi:hypothetical protein